VVQRHWASTCTDRSRDRRTFQQHCREHRSRILKEENHISNTNSSTIHYGTYVCSLVSRHLHSNHRGSARSYRHRCRTSTAGTCQFEHRNFLSGSDQRCLCSCTACNRHPVCLGVQSSCCRRRHIWCQHSLVRSSTRRRCSR
jgi:hypothetical protein